MNQAKLETKKETRGRKSFLSQDPVKKREYFKQHAQKYYSNPVNREKQKLRMVEYRKNNKELIKQRATKHTKSNVFEKKLKKCWIARGLFL